MRKRDRNIGDGESIVAAYTSWKRWLRAKKDATDRYFEGVCDPVMLGLFIPFLESKDYPTTVDDITDDMVVEFIAMLRETPRPRTGRPYAPTTVAIYDRALRAFFSWAEKTDRVEVSPFRRVDRPEVPKAQRDAHSEADVRAMLATCSTRSFIDRRDEALIRVLYDSGLRLSNIAALDRDEPDLDRCEFRSVRVKGGDEHYGRFTPETAYALDEYVGVRKKHPLAHRRELWLGQNGPMTANGIRQAIKKRARRAGLDTFPHRFRHTFVHVMKEAGAPDEVIQELGGWRSRAMVDYYGASTRKERAREWYTKNAPGRSL